MRKQTLTKHTFCQSFHLEEMIEIDSGALKAHVEECYIYLFDTNRINLIDLRQSTSILIGSSLRYFHVLPARPHGGPISGIKLKLFVIGPAPFAR